MKIFVNSRLVTKKATGIQNYIINLYKEILDLDKTNEYIFLQTDKSKTIGKTEVISMPKFPIFNVIFDCFLVNRILKKHNQEKIVFHGTSFILPFLKLKNVFYILTVHDVSFKLFPKNHSLFFNLYYDFLLKRSLCNADEIISVSENTRQDLINIYKISPSKIKTIYSGVDNFYDAFDKNLEIKEKDSYFLVVTTHPKRKNTYSVLDAFAKSSLLRKHRLIVAGSLADADWKELLDYSEKLGIKNNLKIVGYVSEEKLRDLYCNALCFIYPSFYEGFGIPVLEAIRSKCPVIASNTSSIPEILPIKYSYLINPYSVDDIIRKMESMILLSLSEREKLVEENYSFSKKFIWEKSALEFIKLFKS